MRNPQKFLHTLEISEKKSLAQWRAFFEQVVELIAFQQKNTVQLTEQEKRVLQDMPKNLFTFREVPGYFWNGISTFFWWLHSLLFPLLLFYLCIHFGQIYFWLLPYVLLLNGINHQLFKPKIIKYTLLAAQTIFIGFILLALILSLTELMVIEQFSSFLYLVFPLLIPLAYSIATLLKYADKIKTATSLKRWFYIHVFSTAVFFLLSFFFFVPWFSSISVWSLNSLIILIVWEVLLCLTAIIWWKNVQKQHKKTFRNYKILQKILKKHSYKKQYKQIHKAATSTVKKLHLLKVLHQLRVIIYWSTGLLVWSYLFDVYPYGLAYLLISLTLLDLALFFVLWFIPFTPVWSTSQQQTLRKIRKQLISPTQQTEVFKELQGLCNRTLLPFFTILQEDVPPKNRLLLTLDFRNKSHQNWILGQVTLADQTKISFTLTPSQNKKQQGIESFQLQFSLSFNTKFYHFPNLSGEKHCKTEQKKQIYLQGRSQKPTRLRLMQTLTFQDFLKPIITIYQKLQRKEG